MRAARVLLGLAALATCAGGIAAPRPADPLPASAGTVAPFDERHSRVGFHLRTRWNQRLRGEFPVHAGEVEAYPDGRRQVRVRLDSRRAEVVGHPRYTRWARGPEFFDVARHPTIEFVSEHYPPELLRDGGRLHGTLTLRGIARPVRFEVAPSTCARPGRDCDVVADGSVDRTDFGMDGWRMVVGDRVGFELRVRTRDAGPTP